MNCVRKNSVGCPVRRLPPGPCLAQKCVTGRRIRTDIVRSVDQHSLDLVFRQTAKSSHPRPVCRPVRWRKLPRWRHYRLGEHPLLQLQRRGSCAGYQHEADHSVKNRTLRTCRSISGKRTGAPGRQPRNLVRLCSQILPANSLFTLEGESIQEIYGSREQLRLGVETMLCVLQGEEPLHRCAPLLSGPVAGRAQIPCRRPVAGPGRQPSAMKYPCKARISNSTIVKICRRTEFPSSTPRPSARFHHGS